MKSNATEQWSDLSLCVDGTLYTIPTFIVDIYSDVHYIDSEFLRRYYDKNWLWKTEYLESIAFGQVSILCESLIFRYIR